MDGTSHCSNAHEDRRTGKKMTVFLFKSPKDGEDDKFTETLEQAGLTCVSIPTLSFCFINQPSLMSHLTSIHLFSAIIFTSVRAVEAVTNIVKEFEDAQKFTKVHSYAVGRTTGEAARKAGFDPIGENTGNAQALAKFIVQEVELDESKPLLYPCSNIHRDTLREVLTSHGIPVTEVVAYETCANDHMKAALQEAVQLNGVPDYAVFFSPSGFQHAHSLLDVELLPLDRVKIIALGPTTNQCICDHGYTPFGMTEKPEPSSLLQLLS